MISLNSLSDVLHVNLTTLYKKLSVPCLEVSVLTLSLCNFFINKDIFKLQNIRCSPDIEEMHSKMKAENRSFKYSFRITTRSFECTFYRIQNFQFKPCYWHSLFLFLPHSFQTSGIFRTQKCRKLEYLCVFKHLNKSSRMRLCFSILRKNQEFLVHVLYISEMII